MRVLISGATGLIGSALAAELAVRGHTPVRLGRDMPRSGAQAIRWDPDSGAIEAAALEGLEAVVHLAGDPIFRGRWTARKKARIRESRVVGTRILIAALSKHPKRPGVFLCASAVGYYGDQGEDILREDSPSGRGFLPLVTRAWEAEAARASVIGMREARLRFGIVLAPQGGVLGALMPLFRMGLGARLGSGRQWMSWIALEDAIGAILHVLEHPELSGPVNLTAPAPVRNAEFTKALGRALHRPTVLWAPAFALRLALGGSAADQLLLASARVEPAKLLASGYWFRHPELDGALHAVLKAR